MIDLTPNTPQNEKNEPWKERERKVLNEIARENHERRIKKRMENLGIPKRFRKPYEIKNSQQKEIFESVENYILNAGINFSEGRNLFFIGRMGTGKTHLSYYLGEKLVNKGYSVLALTAAEYIAEIRDTWKKESAVRAQEVREKYQQVDFLILDEIGVTVPEPSEETEFYTLLKARYDDQLPTVFCANVGFSEFPQYLGARAFDKIKENSHSPLIFTWQSLRN